MAQVKKQKVNSYFVTQLRLAPVGVIFETNSNKFCLTLDVNFEIMITTIKLADINLVYWNISRFVADKTS
jgi:hypothetical protein